MPWQPQEKEGSRPPRVPGHFPLRPAPARHCLADLAGIRAAGSCSSVWPALEGPLGQPCPPEQRVQLCGFWLCRNESNGTNPREELDLGEYCRESNLSSCHGHEVQLPFPLSFYLLKNMMKMYVSSQIFRTVSAWQNTFLFLFSHHFTLGTRRHTEFMCFCTELIPVSLITKLGKGKTEFLNWWHIYTRIVTL